MIRALVAMPSASSFEPAHDEGNRAVINLLASWMEDLGASIEIMPLPGKADRANLIASIGGSGDQGLVLSGHSDTVGCEKGRWSSDPYQVTERDGRLYGLGISDMKSFFAVAIEAMRAFEASSLRQPVILVASADEECAMEGARAMVAAGRPRARYALIGEPTDLVPVRMHKGMMMERISLSGRSGHSSQPHGDSALEAMVRVANALLAWREELQASYRDPAFEFPVPTLNLGTIRGGDHPNRICGTCEMEIDLRPLPSMDLGLDALRTELGKRVQSAIEGTGVTASIRTLYPGTKPMRTAADSPLVRAAEELTGTRASTVAYGTEAPHFAALGMDTLLLGPGNIAQAHQPDEFLRVDRIEPAIKAVRGIIAKFCT